jgi:hypothetical protein
MANVARDDNVISGQRRRRNQQISLTLVAAMLRLQLCQCCCTGLIENDYLKIAQQPLSLQQQMMRERQLGRCGFQGKLATPAQDLGYDYGRQRNLRPGRALEMCA